MILEVTQVYQERETWEVQILEADIVWKQVKMLITIGKPIQVLFFVHAVLLMMRFPFNGLGKWNNLAQALGSLHPGGRPDEVASCWVQLAQAWSLLEE